MAAADRKRIPHTLRDELLRRAGEQCAICHRMLLEVDKLSRQSKHIADTVEPELSVSNLRAYARRTGRGVLGT